ncbi:MAG: hypothetical protein ACK52I_05555 [Pseudomonadota bacterium]
MSRPTLTVATTDADATVGGMGSGYLGAQAMCAKCGQPDLTGVPDSLYGGGWDVCGSCRHRVRVPLRRTPPPEPTPVPGSLAHLNPPDALTAAQMGIRLVGVAASAAARTARYNERARKLAGDFPAEWTRCDAVQRDIGLLDAAMANLVTRLMHMRMVERKLDQVVTVGGARRTVIMVRRVA